LQLVNPFLRTIERLEERAMFHFHTPQSRGDKQALRRRIKQMDGVTDKEWFDDQEMFEKWTRRTRRAAVEPFSLDENIDESRTYMT